MSTSPDFEFGFGKGRYLRGRGWRGIIALALLLTIMLVTAEAGIPAIDNSIGVARLLWRHVHGIDAKHPTAPVQPS